MKGFVWKHFTLVFVLLTLTIALSGCSGEKAGEDSSQIIVGIPQDLEDSLDPNKAVAAGTKEVLFNLFEGLVKPEPDGSISPAVASEYNLLDDGKTYVFTLREGVKFHNGQAVTAEDVKYSIEKCADTTAGEPLISAYSNIAAVNVRDEKTVEVVLEEANTEFLAEMATVNAAIVPAGHDKADTEPIGTGPFQFVSRSPQENFIVEKFDEYWGEGAKLDKVIFKVCANADTIVMDLKGGSIDMFARLSSTQAGELAGSDFNIEEGTMNLVQALYLNHAQEPFNDERVRQAMCYAVNKQEIMDFMADGKGTAIGSSMFPAFGKYFLPELSDKYPQDIEKAKALLSEAGYPDGFSMTITVPSNYQPHIDTAQVLVEQLKQAGINASINLVEWDTWLSDVYTNRNYESTLVGVDASSMTARALLERFTSDYARNFINYNNPEYDALFEQAVSSTDEAAQTEYYKQMETMLADTAANVYIQDMAELVAIHKRFGGYTFYPLYVQDMSKIYPVEQ